MKKSSFVHCFNKSLDHNSLIKLLRFILLEKGEYFTKNSQMKQYLILLLFVPLLFLSCNFDKNEDHLNLMELEHLETLYFPLDSMTIRYKLRMGYIEDLNLLYVHNENPSKIDFYDFDNQKHKETVVFTKSGLLKSRQKTMVHVVSPDSIFVFDQVTSNLTLYLDKGEKVSYEIKVLDSDNENFGIMPWCYFYRTYSNDFLFGVTIRGESVKKALASPILAFSENTKEKTFYGTWPDSYAKDNQMSFAGPSFLEIEDQLFLSMSFSDELQVLSSRGELIKTILASSELMHPYRSMNKKSSTFEESARYQLTNSKYRNLLYDKSSGYLIREGSIGSNIPDNVSPLSGEKFPSRNDDDIYFVLVVIDPEKGKIGEIQRPAIGNDAFSTEDGIFIQDRLTDPSNEDVLIVKRMKIKGEKKS